MTSESPTQTRFLAFQIFNWNQCRWRHLSVLFCFSHFTVVACCVDQVNSFTVQWNKWINVNACFITNSVYFFKLKTRALIYQVHAQTSAQRSRCRNQLVPELTSDWLSVHILAIAPYEYIWGFDKWGRCKSILILALRPLVFKSSIEKKLKSEMDVVMLVSQVDVHCTVLFLKLKSGLQGTNSYCLDLSQSFTGVWTSDEIRS